MPKASSRRSPAQLESDLLEVAQHLVRGLSGHAIARATQRPSATVTRDVKAVMTLWRTERVVKIDELVAREEAKLDRREAAIWDAIDAALSPRTETYRKARSISIPDGAFERYVIDQAGLLQGEQKRKIIPVEINTGERTIRSLVPAAYFTALAQVWDQRARLHGYDRAQGGGEMPDLAAFFTALSASTATLWNDEPDTDDDEHDDD